MTSLGDRAMGRYCYDQAMPEQSSLFRRLNQYTKLIFRHFGVSGRLELLAR